ncbi:HEAT repeat domain-containing protein [Evansella tamaricis]|uniref:HEAT repeat domain-containing protein n=1 Tax=Evansella tamaricis TaxID=2069301 RepID=A0ABS6JBZ9_9BACI|nr:HEAT repeat domain-containing protein [Evansella tamaricis]MBU9711199.1 HEAT repeat domain-containing protein [Evansella tamaricis]
MSNENRTDLPENFNELKKNINRMSNWRERLNAVDELGQWKNRETIELLKHAMTGDPVYKVQTAAFRKLQAMGEAVTMPEKKEEDPIKGTKKILVRIKKSLPKDHSYEDFKEKVKKMRIDLYDTYEGDKGPDFDKWLEETWAELRTR